MQKVVKLKDIDFRIEGLIELCYDDGSRGIEIIDINPKGNRYKSFATAQRAIKLRLRNRFGKKVQIGKDLQNAINDLAGTLSLPIDKEEEEVARAIKEMREVEQADRRRERWLYQRM